MGNLGDTAQLHLENQLESRARIRDRFDESLTIPEPLLVVRREAGASVVARQMWLRYVLLFAVMANASEHESTGPSWLAASIYLLKRLKLEHCEAMDVQQVCRRMKGRASCWKIGSWQAACVTGVSGRFLSALGRRLPPSNPSSSCAAHRFMR